MQARVEVEPHLEIEWQAFWLLSSERQIGMGLGPIGWSAIDRYAERNGIDGSDELDRFHRLIRAMDAAFLAHAAAGNEK